MAKFLTLEDRVLPMQHPHLLSEIALEQGASMWRLLAGTGIPEQQLTDPDARISYSAFGLLAINAIAATDNPGLGLDFGTRIRFTHQGFVGLAVMASATVEAALRAHMRFGPIFAAGWDTELRTEPPRASMSLESVIPFGPLRPFAAEALIAGLLPLLRDAGVTTHELRFDYPAPRYAERYASLARAAIMFDQSTIELVFDAAALSRPLSTANALTYALAERLCEAELAKLPKRKRLVRGVRRLVAADGGVYLDLDAVAHALALTPRALRRALKELGTSYQKILDEVRRDEALRHLRTNHGSLDAVADQLGFSDVRSLRRSVRRWTGMSLREIRSCPSVS